MLQYRKFLFDEITGISWLYGCSCDPAGQAFINSLSFDASYVQNGMYNVNTTYPRTIN